MNEIPRPISLGDGQPAKRPIYKYRHAVSFQDTNVVGNVYFACHVEWQGRCRELFLKEHAPQVLADLARDLRLVTLSVSCHYFSEVFVTDEVEIGMMLKYLRRDQIGLDFDYLVRRQGAETVAARGFQEIVCMLQTSNGLVRCEVPLPLRDALAVYH